MMNSPYVRSALAKMALDLAPPLIRDTLLEESGFREEYGFIPDPILSFPNSGVSFQRSSLYDAIRKVLSGAVEKKVINTEGQKWRLKNINKNGKLPNLSLFRGEKNFPLPAFATLSPDRDIRLRFLDKVVSDVNLPNNASDPWHNILSQRALEDDEVDAFHSEFLDTPVAKARSRNRDVKTGQGSISSLVPTSRRYFERLVGEYGGSASIQYYASGSGRKLFDQLSAWRPYDGFLYSLFLSSHASLTEEINVDQLNSEDLVRAFDSLDKHGDRISQLGAIEVGLRVLPSRPDIEQALIEQALIRLIEQIRDDDVNGQASGFKFLSALFCFVDGTLSRTRLLSAEPPFYRRLAALSQAALIQRQLVNVGVDIDLFSKEMFRNHGGQHYLQSLADMRLGPRWDPDFATAAQMKADFFGRILIAAKKYEQNIMGSQIYDLIFGDSAGSLQSLSHPFYSYLSGPLEGTEDTQRTLPPEFAEAIETQLGAEEVGPSSFPAIVNSALIFCIDTDQAELAATALKRSNHHLRNIKDKSQLVAILGGLSTVAAVARSPALADELRILVRKYGRDATYELSIQEAIKICLVAAASRSELSEWTEFVGDWLTELAFGDLKDDEAQEVYLCLNWLCHVVPELWVSCGRADAALLALTLNDI